MKRSTRDNRIDSLRLLMALGRNQISIGEAVDFAWSAYRRRWRLFPSILIAMLSAWVVLEVVVFTTQLDLGRTLPHKLRRLRQLTAVRSP